MTSLKDIIADIRSKLATGSYKNEEHVRLSIVVRIVQRLGWDVWNPEEVFPEFPTVPEEDQSRVDLVLFADSYTPNVFIEIKAIGKLDTGLAKTEKQLRDYNRNFTAIFSVITDGRNWRFYFSPAPGDFARKCFKTLDIVKDDLDGLEKLFHTFLSKSEIASGKAQLEADKYLGLTRLQRTMQEALPKARRLTQEPPFPNLPAALMQLTKASGHSVSAEEAARFIKENAGNERGPDPVSAAPEPEDVEKQQPPTTPVAEAPYIDIFRRQLKDPNNLPSKIWTFIQKQGTVRFTELRKVCVHQFGCKNGSSGAIGASVKMLEVDKHVRIEGRGNERRIVSLE